MNSICFDTETTGLHPNGSDPDEILTISIIGRDGSAPSCWMRGSDRP